jgi:hypothetical protein
MNPDARKRRFEDDDDNFSTHSRSRSRTPSPSAGYPDYSSDDNIYEDSEFLPDEQKEANKAYKKIMTSNFNPVYVKRVFEGLDPIPKGVLHQKFLNKNERYDVRKRVFEKATEVNGNVKAVLQVIDEDFKASTSQPEAEAPVPNSSSSSSSSWYGFGGPRK